MIEAFRSEDFRIGAFGSGRLQVASTWFPPLIPPSLAISPVVLDALPPAANPSTPPVLVVDDQAASRWLLGKMLERLRIDYRFAKDGTEAVALAGTRRWGAFLMDIEMQRLDGDLAAIRLRGLSSFLADVPIIAVTSLPVAEARERCRRAGINGLVRKPVSLFALETQLRRHAAPLFPAEQGFLGGSSRRKPSTC